MATATPYRNGHHRLRLTVRSEISDLTPGRVRGWLRGLPAAQGYTLIVRTSRRHVPVAEAYCRFDARTIIVFLPEPFRPFAESIYPWASGRTNGRRAQKAAFRNRRDLLRFLYLHEYMHWLMWETGRRGAFAEAACDRFALANYRKVKRVRRPMF